VPEHVVIAGAGVVGTCTAYYLARNHRGDGVKSVTLVDPSGVVAPAASGKAGGFLALDWNDGSPTQELTRRSFDLHQEIADELGAESIQYRRLECAAISVAAGSGGAPGVVRRPSGKKLRGVEWADSPGVLGVRPLGTEETIAQVHPKRLCERLWEETKRMLPDSRLVKGRVVATTAGADAGEGEEGGGSGDDKVGVKLEDGTVIGGADAVLFACGPWTANVMRGVKYHSAVIPTDKVLRQCVFFSGCGDPEVYVRPDGTAYCTGFPDGDVVVTERPGEEEVRPEKISEIVRAVREASSSSGGGGGAGGALANDPVVEQACYLPTTDDGVPVMGRLPASAVGVGGSSGNSNAGRCYYIAAGHSCWGILLGPASGEAMASLIATGRRSTDHVDLGRFDPSRFGDGIRIVP